MLVDEGKMKWDDPVTKYLPGFQLYDPYLTRELTVSDLLTHRSGLDAATCSGMRRLTIATKLCGACVI